jgi:hypothetical protein
VTEEHRRKPIQCHRHCREYGGERSDPVTPLHPPSGGAHANVHRGHVCRQDRELVLMCYHADSRCIGAGGAFDSLSGCPQLDVPRVGTPAPERCMQLGGACSWGTQARPSGRDQVVPRSKQPRRCQAAEETRGPQSGRAHEGRRALDEVNGPRPRDCGAFAFAFRGLEVLLRSQRDLGDRKIAASGTTLLALTSQ